jgi:hypothetical protein
MCRRSDRRMELEQTTAGTTDDFTGVVGPGDDLDRAGERLVRDGVRLSRIRRRDPASRMSMASCICRPCAVDALHRERSARARISGRTASTSVVTVQILCQSLTDTSPAHTRRVTRGFACGVPFTASATSFRTATGMRAAAAGVP